MSSKDKKDQKMELKENKKNEEKKTTDLGSLEEDDDFEEFPVEDWNEKQESKEDLQVWEDDWDEDDIEDDFSQQLRAELEKNGVIKK